MAEIKLQVGKTYKTNDGTKVKCIKYRDDGLFLVKGHSNLIWVYNKNGLLLGFENNEFGPQHIKIKFGK